jgi:uncharacterized protein (DUF362 family)
MTHVAISLADKIQYPEIAPYHPSIRFPEYHFSELSLSENYVYSAIRDGFVALSLDQEHFGTVEWNPFGNFIQPGQKVVIKPNFVLHYNYTGADPFSVITHGSVIRAVIDFVIIALKGTGSIIIADAPQMNADFSRLVDISGIEKIMDFYKSKVSGIKFYIRDLRREQTYYRHGIVWERKKLVGDPEGYTLVDLGEDSVMCGIDAKKIYGADYHRNETIEAHSNGHHYYLIANTYLNADTVIHIPKLKTHYKAGITVNLKGMVGLSGNKNLIPHYRIGVPSEGGDEFSKSNILLRLDRWIKDKTLGINWKFGRYPYVIWKQLCQLLLINKANLPEEKGNWYGNDIVWRAALDLMRVLIYSDRNGKLCEKPQRKYFSIVDGIVSGEADGPLGPLPRSDGVILCGENPVAVDYASAIWMKFNPARIPIIRNSWNLISYPIILEPSEKIDIIFTEKAKLYFENSRPFKSPKGWQGNL